MAQEPINLIVFLEPFNFSEINPGLKKKFLYTELIVNNKIPTNIKAFFL